MYIVQCAIHSESMHDYAAAPLKDDPKPSSPSPSYGWRYW